MKATHLILGIFCAALLSACNGNTDTKTPPPGSQEQPLTGTDTCREFISMDTANLMIASYLQSINANTNDSDLHALVIDADCLREYLNDERIAKVKVMFAHTLEYVNNGGQNQYVGYQSDKLTVIVAGFDSRGDYVYHRQGNESTVLNHAVPCPAQCPPRGTASYNLLN